MFENILEGMKGMETNMKKMKGMKERNETYGRRLQKLGHKMSRYRDRGSVVCSLVQNNGTIYANADYRKKGEVYGMN
ncbi:hypothetical protein LSTR_LSTR001420 [Laodelphax striatellus]|uniref:Uncharacterized protein n=1 Tax=Laodelphax striatellus TaxID=195883 RepID=A0A482X9H9_LAOST|nr:hypothetical protein LSTR_LSTR001420 [Laodelphax striatellus]